jgi:hypothetical protein
MIDETPLSLEEVRHGRHTGIIGKSPIKKYRENIARELKY